MYYEKKFYEICRNTRLSKKGKHMKISPVSFNFNSYKLNKTQKGYNQNNTNPINNLEHTTKLPLAQLQGITNINFGSNSPAGPYDIEGYDYVFPYEKPAYCEAAKYYTSDELYDYRPAKIMSGIGLFSFTESDFRDFSSLYCIEDARMMLERGLVSAFYTNLNDAISMVLGTKASEMELRTLFAQAPEYRDLTKYVAGDYIRHSAKQMGDIAPKMYAKLLVTQDMNKKNILHIAMNYTINALSEVTKDEARDSFAQALQMEDIYGNTPLFYATSDQLDLYRKILADKASEIIDSAFEA